MPSHTATRDAILDAAEQEFAGRGFAATTIKHLAAAAGVNSALLYYYFADKETLYREMLRRVLGEFASEGVRRLDGAASPEAGVRQFVELQMEFMSARPHVPRLIVRELIDYDATHAEVQIAHAAAGLFKRLCEHIERGQREGAFRRDVEPRFAAVSVVAQVAYMLMARPAVTMLLGEGPGGPSPETLRRFARHAGDFSVAALTRHVAGTAPDARVAGAPAVASPATDRPPGPAPRNRPGGSASSRGRRGSPPAR